MAADGPKSSLLKNKYRVVILDDDTLGEIRSTQITGLGVLLASILALILISLFTVLIISYTPLRYLIPGYADVNNNKAYTELAQQLDVIEDELEAQRVYANGMQQLLNPSGMNLKQALSQSSDAEVTQDISHIYFCSPLKGTVSDGFNPADNHYGIDLVAQSGSPIKNILEGVVMGVDWSEKNGHTISVQHDHDLVSIFKHNASIMKKVGDRVRTGEAIAIIGNTGEGSSGPHVHFELWHGGQAVNPADYMDF